MKTTVKKALKNRMRQNVKHAKKELKILSGIGTRYRIKREPVFKVAISSLKKDIRLFQRLNKKV